MYFKQTNQTAIRSQHMIADALLHLMKRKHFNQISITEICEEAAIGRKTFYRNFEQKEDVIDFRLDILCAEFERVISGHPPEEQLYLYFSFAKKHIDFFIVMHKNGFLPVLQKKISIFLPAAMPVWSEDAVEQEYRCRYIAAGIEAIMQVWVERGFQEEIETVVSFARQAQEKQIFVSRK